MLKLKIDACQCVDIILNPKLICYYYTVAFNMKQTVMSLMHPRLNMFIILILINIIIITVFQLL